MSDKKCPYDGKKLRSDNTKGVCAKCSARGRTLENAPQTSGADEAPPVSGKKQERHGQELKEFRQVAKLLGVDGDQLLVEFARGWLSEMRAKARALVDGVEA